MRNFDAWENRSRSGSLRAFFVNWERKPRACLARTHHQETASTGRDRRDLGAGSASSFALFASFRAVRNEHGTSHDAMNEQKRCINIGFQSRLPRLGPVDFHPSVKSSTLQRKIGQPFGEFTSNPVAGYDRLLRHMVLLLPSLEYE
jgi:hypothetical protein